MSIKREMEDFSELEYLDVHQASIYFGIDKVKIKGWVHRRNSNDMARILIYPPTGKSKALIHKDSFLEWFHSHNKRVKKEKRDIQLKIYAEETLLVTKKMKKFFYELYCLKESLKEEANESQDFKLKVAYNKLSDLLNSINLVVEK